MSLKYSKNLFFFLLIFSPLAFGTTEPWSYAIMESITGIACFLYLIHILKNKDDLLQIPGIAPLIFFLLYILFQIVPFPPFIVKFLSPAAFGIHQTANLLTDSNPWMTISINTKATLSEFFRYSTYVLYYVLTVQLLKKKEMLQTTVFIIAIFGGVLAFSSILQFYLTEDMALWFRHSPINSIVVGPYANHNHYAGLMELMFPVVLGLFLFYRPRIGNTSILRGIAEILSQEKANIHILLGTSAMLIIVSIFVSLSRGAMISTCFSLTLFIFLLLKRRISKGSTTLLIGVVIISALSIGWFGWDQIFDRFAKLKNAQGQIYENRLDFWKDTRHIINQYKITGSGMGLVSKIYPPYRSYKSKRMLSHAHNDYLELLAEGGIIAFCLAFSFLFTLFYKTYKVFSKRRDGFSIYIYIGCITALFSILIHSFTDFNMHIGANGLWFFFIAGLAVSAANTSLRNNAMETRLLPVASSYKVLFSSAAFIIVLFLIIGNASNLIGKFYYSNIKNFSMSVKTPVEVLRKIGSVAELASQFDPLEADYPFKKANTSWFLGDLALARNKFVKSIQLDPLDSFHLSRYGNFLSKQGETNKAKIAIEKSMQYDRTKPEYSFQFATWLFANDDYEQGIDYIRKTLELDEKYFNRAITVMIVSNIDKRLMIQAIPALPGPSIEYAYFLSRTGKTQEAIDKFLTTLDLIELYKNKETKNIKNSLKKIQSYYYKIYNFFIKYNDLKNAMEVMERAEKNLPMNAGIKVTLGNLYYKQGILYKALDKFDHALLLDPANKQALKMIKTINQ